MTEDLQGRVALVTGALGGIGGALALRLAQAGANVAVAYRTGDPGELLEALRGTGVRAAAVQGDLAEPDVPLRLLREAQAALGPVDVLVANAGLGTRAPLADVDAALWQRTLAVNLTAPFLLCQAAVPPMAERGWGASCSSRRWPPSPAGSSGRTTRRRRPACSA